MELPTININGTSRESLLEQYLNAMHAVLDAAKVLQGIDVHGRDYVHGGDIIVAMREHQARVRHLLNVYHDLDVIATHVHGPVTPAVIPPAGGTTEVVPEPASRVFGAPERADCDQHVIDWIKLNEQLEPLLGH